MRHFGIFIFLLSLKLVKCNFSSEKLKSWDIISHVELKLNENNGHSYRATLTTSGPELGSVEFTLKPSEIISGYKIQSSIVKCQYEGFVMYNETIDVRNPARLKICPKNFDESFDISGLFYYNNVVYNILTQDDGSQIIFSANNIKTVEKERTPMSRVLNKNRPGSSWLFQNQVFEDEKKNMNESNRIRRSLTGFERYYLEVIVFVDFEYISMFNLTEESAIDAVVEIIHLADFYYALVEEANIHLVLVDVIPWTSPEEDPFFAVLEVEQLLDAFAEYHSSLWSELPNHDNAILLTSKILSDGEGVLGLAYIDTLCQGIASTNWVWDNTGVASMTASTLAHEVGHNLGLSHNFSILDLLSGMLSNGTCFCSGLDSCLMDPYVSSVPPEAITECQQQNIREFITKGPSFCLLNEPVKNIEAAYCGDYIVNQASEECDCGDPETCEDPCCNSRRCTLKQGALCSTMSLCCDQLCGLRSEGEVCRGVRSSCDVAEYCDGLSSECPTDEFVRSGSECDVVPGSVGHCFFGECISERQQCNRKMSRLSYEEAVEWHNSTLEACWDLNLGGTEAANCGRDYAGTTGGEYLQCNETNKRCGNLQCSSSHSIFDEFDYIEAQYGPDYDYLVNNFKDSFIGGAVETEIGVFTYCYSIGERSFWSALDATELYHYVRDGTWCDQESFCFNKECLHISMYPGITECPFNCFGRGNCNGTNQCECDEGFDTPHCESLAPSASHFGAMATIAMLWLGRCILE
ncbi:zinc metalloproteinase-disintegrin-like isoform X2 [Symsagittifera roscoffensis]|uniref:zinc metalloproteinase-disintegrin-like isoform X2 n=1 Tax=Symsagittifera roscoffensis TaxID=84072 RepID=UPI00307B151F